MGYYASYDGHIRFKEKPSDETIKVICDFFGDHDYDVDGLGISVYGDDKYYADCIEEGLSKLEPYVKNGEIKYHGEDECFWRFIFKDGKWTEENGKIYYESDTPSKVEKEDVPEFLGQIVDIFEEELEKYDIPKNIEDPIISGTLYDNITSKLNLMMNRWSIYKN